MRNRSTLFLILIITGALVGSALETKAQMSDAFNVHSWLYGKVVLSSGDSLKGAVIYHPVLDVVQIAGDDGAINSFSPVNVSYFIIVGVYEGRPQLFRSLLWSKGQEQDAFRAPMFFEEICQGNIVLMKRYTGKPAVSTENLTAASVEPSYYPHFASAPDDMQEFFYVQTPDGKIITLRNRKRELLKLFGDKSDQVKRYVRENRLDYNDSRQLVAIVNYYNSL
jgi:hypothetical protein